MDQASPTICEMKLKEEGGKAGNNLMCQLVLPRSLQVKRI